MDEKEVTDFLRHILEHIQSLFPHRVRYYENLDDVNECIHVFQPNWDLYVLFSQKDPTRIIIKKYSRFLYNPSNISEEQLFRGKISTPIEFETVFFTIAQVL